MVLPRVLSSLEEVTSESAMSNSEWEYFEATDLDLWDDNNLIKIIVKGKLLSCDINTAQLLRNMLNSVVRTIDP